ncbi:EAL domain-containing protein [Telmatospirillum sp.]|uniref:EAL domain-containing response regulator n=1 Tax=Telmatospirillum sp. TaxID=2079197 RepID=UPI00284B63FB|nr:EAL domain-containing protein [Telmatospirillum sp.]MDR3439366.1 EAL domain-containing protein [Telmatospirillum sp.]
MNDFVSFLAEEETPVQKETLPPWIIGVIDDEPAVFEATQIALEGTQFEGRSITVVYANSAKSGRQLIENTPDLACILLDVVMETEHAGLDLVRDIRETLENNAIRIILRTGQPGYAPPMDVIRRYDINDYKEKPELTQVRLWTSVACALRSYQQIVALEMNRRGLRIVIEASSDLLQRRGIDDFACGVVTQIAAHLRVKPDGLVCVSRPMDDGEAVVVGAAGKFAGSMYRPVSTIDDPQAVRTINIALEQRHEVTGVDDMALFITGGDWIGAIYIKGRTEIRPLDRELLQLYCRNVSLGFENVRLFEAISATAYIDRITGLPTRPRLEQTIDRLLARTETFGVLVMTVDRYSDYTILLGNQFAETMLGALSSRLGEIQPMRERTGCLFGDVFAVVLDGDASQDVRQAISRIEQPLTISGRTLWVSLSFGYVASGSDDLSGRELIRRAEMALHKAQQTRVGGLTVFTPEIEETQHSRILLAHELRDAMDTNQIYLCYQPQVHIESGKTVAVEALMRWRHPTRGDISPTLFIPVAEATGLISDLGKWVARRACRDMRPFIERGAIERVTINLSPVQLRNPDCFAGLHAIVMSEGLSPNVIEWEITESAVLDSDVAIAQLRQASALGYTIALDDFGTGQSSLSMIRSLPLDVVKIDRSFLLEVASDVRARTILQSVAAICNELGLETIAEGVENQEHLRAVQEARIGNVQGYLYSRPHEPDELTRWLAQRSD